MKFGYIWPSGFRGEVVLKCGRTTDGRRRLPILKAPPIPKEQADLSLHCLSRQMICPKTKGLHGGYSSHVFHQEQ